MLAFRLTADPQPDIYASYQGTASAVSQDCQSLAFRPCCLSLCQGLKPDYFP
jgi:hypothetical protein